MDQASLAKAKRTLDTVSELSRLLDTGLSRSELSILIALVENGCNPEVNCLYLFSDSTDDSLATNTLHWKPL